MKYIIHKSGNNRSVVTDKKEMITAMRDLLEATGRSLEFTGFFKELGVTIISWED